MPPTTGLSTGRAEQPYRQPLAYRQPGFTVTLAAAHRLRTTLIDRSTVLPDSTGDQRSDTHRLVHMTEQPADLFTAIDHVGVAVNDIDAAIAFYRDTYGMSLVHEEVNEEQGVREAMMAVGSSGSCVQLLAPLTPESTIAKFLDRSGPGVQQVAYRVVDVDAVSRTLRERGLRLLFEAPRRGTSNSRVNFIHPKDAGGILVELVEPAASPSH